MGTSDNDEYEQVIVVRSDLKMGKGKIATQASHASADSTLCMEREYPEVINVWMGQGEKKVVLKVGSERELMELYSEVKKDDDVPYVTLIRDAGRTQLEPGTKTAIGFGPVPTKVADKFISKLKLL